MNLRLLVTAAILSTGTAFADFESAAEAYRNKNYPAAREEFERLAQGGDPRAQTVLAMMYKFGEATAVDPAAAFTWYLKAAEAGYAPAQFNVGTMYAEGNGTERNSELAIEWLTRAAESGYERANEALAALDAEVVRNTPAVDPDIPWSQSWNFRLPNEVRYQEAWQSPPVGERFRVQLGAMRSQSSANRLWRSLADVYPELFHDLRPIIRRSETHDVYRVQTGPFDDYKAARDFCDRLLGRGTITGCLPLQ